VISEFFSNRDGSWHSHVDLGLWADAMLIAPATAASIGKMAHGIADNMLITTYLSCKSPVFIAPAMDLDMFAHQTTQQNLDKLRSLGHFIIEPQVGELASHLVGKGRMEEPDNIMRTMEDYFWEETNIKKKKILITAGPTYEKIDPVRFIGNYSSGKMGFALAEVCAQKGAEVILVAGPVALEAKHPNIKRINVESAHEMYQVAVASFSQCDAAILCAAVADYRPDLPSLHKIKREKEEKLTLTLIPNEDIAASLGNMKKKNQLLIGFALETGDELKNAKDKLRRKNFDFIVLNSLNDAGAGFKTDTNKVTIADNKGAVQVYPLKLKNEVAQDIINKLITLLCL
jgi:phosphopantothenoylcysteine decarboxylase/phosphopantothenate--cysteine ligase